MSLIVVKDLKAVLPDDADDTDRKLTLAVNTASSFVNTWTAKKYYPWPVYDTSGGTYRVPDEIYSLCVEVAKAKYYISIGQVNRDGSEEKTWNDFLDDKRQELMDIIVHPKEKTQTISLTDDAMLIGDTDGTYNYPQILPDVWVESGAGNVWRRRTDFYITKGVDDGEYTDAWYLRSLSSGLEGTLHYRQTYRSDFYDYMRCPK